MAADGSGYPVVVATSKKAKEIEAAWLASLSPTDRRSIPATMPPKDRVLGSSGSDLDKLKDERLRPRSRPHRKLPKGLRSIAVVESVSTNDVTNGDDATSRTVSRSRIARGGEKPTSAILIGNAELPQELSSADTAMIRRVVSTLSIALQFGFSEVRWTSAAAAAYELAFGTSYADSWINVLLDEVERACKLSIRLGREKTMPLQDRRELRQSIGADRVLESVRRQLTNLPDVVVPVHINETTVARLINRFGFEGGGGKTKKLSRATIAAALHSPKTIAKLLGSTSEPKPKK